MAGKTREQLQRNNQMQHRDLLAATRENKRLREVIEEIEDANSRHVREGVRLRRTLAMLGDQLDDPNVQGRDIKLPESLWELVQECRDEERQRKANEEAALSEGKGHDE